MTDDLRSLLHQRSEEMSPLGVDLVAVTREGGRRVRRRRVATAVGGVAAVAVAAVAVASLHGAAPRAVEPAGPVPSASTSPGTTASAAPGLLTFSDDDGLVTSPEQVPRKLGSTSQSFQDFVTGQIEQLIATSTCADGQPRVDVEVFRSDGWALGGVGDCGGYLAVWRETDGTWSEVLGGQDVWACADLEALGAPSDVVGTRCWDEDGTGDVIRYRHD
ncbi:hypothetical protein [Nocardioides sp. GY 10127]|uniref:hypothetical protein n=1 Tax=Nocardioides sp. GY 10127 TaxID=2569762 RepID=UPI0010A9275B|nr:hypothetical protein [Nocardioides sp. GY 10127]TIC86639.1 hypothetical protein E8D37_01770 [Nocardioides sp. GY 10127]